MRFDDDGLCTDLREYWQTPPIARPMARLGRVGTGNEFSIIN